MTNSSQRFHRNQHVKNKTTIKGNRGKKIEAGSIGKIIDIINQPFLIYHVRYENGDVYLIPNLLDKIK